jgi:hypothetical protein
MAGFESKSMLVSSRLGLVNVHFPKSAEHLNLTYISASSPLYVTSDVPVKIKGRKDVMLLNAPSVNEQGDSFTLGTGEPKHLLDVDSDASVSVTVGHPKEMEFEGQLRLKEEGSCLHPLHFSVDPHRSNKTRLSGQDYATLIGDQWFVPHEGFAEQNTRFKGGADLVACHPFMLRNHRRLRFKIVNNSDGQVVAEGFRMVHRLLQEDWDRNQPIVAWKIRLKSASLRF